MLRSNSIEKKTQVSIWYFIVALFVILLIQGLLLRPHVESIPYSKFRDLVAQKKVKELVINKEYITGLLEETRKDSAAAQNVEWHNFTAVRVEDPTLIADLRTNGIDFKGNIESNWFAAVLDWIFSMVIFFGLWVFLARKMEDGMHQNLMAIGKSNAKVAAS